MSFMSGLFNFVADLLNGLFSAASRNEERRFGWYDGPITDDSAALQIVTASTNPVDSSIPVPAAMPQPTMAQRAHDDVAALQKIDPDFSELQFLGQAGVQYAAVLAAEGAMNGDALAGVATSDFISAFQKRVEDWNNAGLRRVVSDVKLLSSTTFKVSIDGTCQGIVVRFTSSGVRYTQDVATGAAVKGSHMPDYFTEFATFVRPAGTTTPKSAAAGGATHCPSCGAPTVAGAAKCPYCGAQLTGTGSAWLLDKLSVSAYT